MEDYIEFKIIERKPRTFVYSVRNVKHGEELGRVFWYGAWRQYVFESMQGAVWSCECLKKVADFLTSINKNHREGENRTKD